MEQTMQITYLNHSSFFLDDSVQAMLIDYGALPPRKRIGNLKDGIFQADLQFAKHENLIGYSSHRHRDHFDENLINQFINNKLLYILSDEENLPVKEYMANDYFLRLLPQSRLVLKDFYLANTGSTDQGGALLFQKKDRDFSIYFGADLAIWADMEIYYKGFAKEFEWLKEQLKGFAPVKIAFLPSGTSDGYQEYPLLEGSKDLIELLKPEIVIPMHGYGYPNYYPSFAKEMQKRVDLLQVKISTFKDFASKDQSNRSVTIVYPENTGEMIKVKI